MKTTIVLNSFDDDNNATFSVCEDATLSEVIDILELALRTNGYVFDKITVEQKGLYFNETSLD